MPKIAVRLPTQIMPQIASDYVRGPLPRPEWQFWDLIRRRQGEPRLVGGISVMLWESGPPVDGLIDLFGTADDFITVRFADRIELAALKKKKGDTTGKPDDYAEYRSIQIDAVDAHLLCYLLSSDNTYKWNEDCAPDLHGYDYRFRVKFFRQQRKVEVDLSLEAGNYAPPVARVAKEGRNVAAKSFEYAYPEIASIIEHSFPGEIP